MRSPPVASFFITTLIRAMGYKENHGKASSPVRSAPPRMISNKMSQSKVKPEPQEPRVAPLASSSHSFLNATRVKPEPSDSVCSFL